MTSSAPTGRGDRWIPTVAAGEMDPEIHPRSARVGQPLRRPRDRPRRAIDVQAAARRKRVALRPASTWPPRRDQRPGREGDRSRRVLAVLCDSTSCVSSIRPQRSYVLVRTDFSKGFPLRSREGSGRSSGAPGEIRCPHRWYEPRQRSGTLFVRRRATAGPMSQGLMSCCSR
jgi:hypothetical protein